MTLLPTVSQDDLLEFDEDLEEEENPESWVQIPPRHCSRLVSLQVLYEVDLMEHAAEEALAWSLGVFPTNVEVLEFAWKLVSGVLGNLEFLDEQIRVYAPAWPVERPPTSSTVMHSRRTYRPCDGRAKGGRSRCRDHSDDERSPGLGAPRSTAAAGGGLDRGERAPSQPETPPRPRRRGRRRP